jgi:heme oxygenase
MTDDTAYTPPKIWTWAKENGGQFANAHAVRFGSHPEGPARVRGLAREGTRRAWRDFLRQIHALAVEARPRSN